MRELGARVLLLPGSQGGRRLECGIAYLKFRECLTFPEVAGLGWIHLKLYCLGKNCC